MTICSFINVWYFVYVGGGIYFEKNSLLCTWGKCYSDVYYGLQQE